MHNEGDHGEQNEEMDQRSGDMKNHEACEPDQQQQNSHEEKWT
jgi:hypothetical protein